LPCYNILTHLTQFGVKWVYEKRQTYLSESVVGCE
jgi:hypothetical protein